MLTPVRAHRREREDRNRVVTTVILLVLVGAGTAMRVQGLTSLGFYRDDAWAALSSRVGIGTAWHMWLGAPGFYFLERSFFDLHPGSTWWAQLLPLAAGIAAIPAIYFLARHFGFRRLAGLVLAGIVCVSPICVIYSTRVKEYSVVFLVSVAVLWVAETARCQPDRTRLTVLTMVSVVAFAVSASLGPVIAGAWIAVAVSSSRDRDHRREVIGFAAIVVVGCVVVAAIFYRHVSPALIRFWNGSYISLGSAHAFSSTVRNELWDLYANLLHLTGVAVVDQPFLLAGLLALIVLGVYRNAAMLGPACAMLAALALSAAHKAPLGAGRTDEYLYPALLLLLASGTVRLWAIASRHLSPAHLRVVGSAVAVVFIPLAIAVIGDSIATAPPYPGVGVQAVAAAVQRNAEPSDHIVVGELARYPWAYYEDRPLQLRFGPNWAAYFTVTSTDPKVFIAPSEYYEGGSHPQRWANALRGPYRIWFVESPPLSLNPTYAALLHDGWHRVRTLTAPGCAAILLERSRS